MRWLLFALTAVLGTLALPTHAQRGDDRCVSVLNEVQGRIGDPLLGERRSEAQRELDAAHAAYKAGDTRKCLRHAERAADMMRDRSHDDRRERRYDDRHDDRYPRR